MRTTLSHAEFGIAFHSFRLALIYPVIHKEPSWLNW